MLINAIGLMLTDLSMFACIGLLLWRRSWLRTDKTEILGLTVLMFVLSRVAVSWDLSPHDKVQPAWILHSDRPYGECEIPFTLYQGHIFVRADFAGISMSCLVDTGGRDIIVQNDDVPYEHLNGQVSYPYGSHQLLKVDWRTVSSIHLGDYELRHPLIISWPRNGPLLGITWDGHPINAILGNRAFKDTVLTIDYQRRKLILHRPDYDITKRLHSPSDCLCDLIPGGTNIGWSPEFLAVKGRVAGHPVPLVLDTGHCGSGMLLTPEFRAQLDVPVGTQPNFRYFIGGSWVTEVTRSLKWSIGNVSGECPGWSIGAWPDHQATIGYNVLRNYRVTIDYTRKKLLLEPNQPGQPAPPSPPSSEEQSDSTRNNNHQGDDVNNWHPGTRERASNNGNSSPFVITININNYDISSVANPSEDNSQQGKNPLPVAR